MSDAEVFINFINDNYKEVKDLLKVTSNQRNIQFDEDIFHNSIIRCYNTITKRGYLKDKSPYGCKSYILRSYFNNIREDKRAACNAKRDYNYTSENIGQLHEDWYNNAKESAKEKIINDMFKDFALLYILMLVEENFPEEYSYLFRLKELIPNMTYTKLIKKTNAKQVRQKVCEVKRWLVENVDKDQIKQEFYEIYGDIL